MNFLKCILVVESGLVMITIRLLIFHLHNLVRCTSIGLGWAQNNSEVVGSGLKVREEIDTSSCAH